jgi:hypothetical protein
VLMRMVRHRCPPFPADSGRVTNVIGVRGMGQGFVRIDTVVGADDHSSGLARCWSICARANRDFMREAVPMPSCRKIVRRRRQGLSDLALGTGAAQHLRSFQYFASLPPSSQPPCG